MNKTRSIFLGVLWVADQKFDVIVYKGLQTLLGWCLWFFDSNAGVFSLIWGPGSYQLMAGYLGSVPFRGRAPPVEIHKSLLVGFFEVWVFFW